MEMRGGFMRPPRERGGLMRPLVPLRGRGVMAMERMRLPPLRPGLIRGGPPVPFVGRGMVIPPHARPRGMGPVMLPRPPMPPPGPMGPLGPRGMMPRAMLPPRPLGPDPANLGDPLANSQIPLNGVVKGMNNQLKNVKDNNISNKNTPAPIQNQPLGNRIVNRNVKVPNRINKVNQNVNQVPGLKKNRKDNKNRRQVNLSQSPQQLQPHQQMQIPTQPPMQPPVQNMHPAQHHSQPPPQQNSISMNSPQMQKHMHPMQPPVSGGGIQQQSQLHPMQQQPSFRGGRNGMNARNRPAGAGMGRGGLINTVQVGSTGRGNVMNRGGPNMPPRGGAAPMPSRGNTIMGGPPPSVQYSSPSSSSYAVPPPMMGSQMPAKRAGPPIGVPPIMQPKRIRYDSPLPANGYHGQYQQQPPPQQAMYSSYDAPPPIDAYNAPPAINAPPAQSYHSAADYNYAPTPQNNNMYSNSMNSSYSSYNNAGTYSGYSSTGGYDSSAEYSAVNTQPMNNAAPDPYTYAPSADSYGYSNFNYSNTQTGYDDYNAGYTDAGGYAAPVQDPTYGQSVGTYGSYAY